MTAERDALGAQVAAVIAAVRGHAPPAIERPVTPPQVRPKPAGATETGRRTPEPQAQQNGKTTGPAKIVAAAIQYEGIGKEHLGIVTMLKRSSRDEYVRQAKLLGWITTAGDMIEATPLGRQNVKAEPLAQGAALRRLYSGTLKGGELAIFNYVTDRYPNWIDRADVGEGVGLKRSSTDEYIRKLKVRRLLTTNDRSQIRASDMLF